MKAEYKKVSDLLVLESEETLQAFEMIELKGGISIVGGDGSQTNCVGADCVGGSCTGKSCTGTFCVGGSCIGSGCIGAGCTGGQCPCHADISCGVIKPEI